MNSFYEKQRNHWSYLFRGIYELIGGAICILAISAVYGWWIFVIVTLLGILGSILEWLNQYFYIKDGFIVKKSGVLNKKTTKIALDKVTTIDEEENILNKLLGVSKLKIDTGAKNDGKSELEFLLKKNEAKEFRKLILKYLEEDDSDSYFDSIDNEKVKFSLEIIDIVKYALIKSKFIWILTMFAFYDKISKVIEWIIGDEKSNEIETFLKNTVNNATDNISSNKSILKLIGIILLTFIIFYILSCLFSIIIKVIKFYGFEIYSKDDNINISYGLLSKKTYSFKKDKILGVKIKQSILGKLFKLYEIESIVIGYGDKSSEKPLIYPVATQEIKEVILNSILCDFKFNGETIKSNKEELKRFIVQSILKVCVVPAIIILCIPQINIKIKIILIFLIFIFSIILGTMKYKNTCIGVDGRVLSVWNGFFTQTQSLVKEDNIQAFEIFQTIFQKNSNICNLKIFICSNNSDEELKISNIPIKIKNIVDQNINY